MMNCGMMSMRVDEDLVNKLKVQAKKEDRSVSSLMRIIIREGLERRGVQ